MHHSKSENLCDPSMVLKPDPVFEILAEPNLSSLKVYGKKVGLILNIKVNHGLDKFGLRVVIHCYRPQGNTTLVLKIQKCY